MGAEVNWQTIYCERSTVEETGHFTWATFRQYDSWIITTIIFETQLKVAETWLPIFDSCVIKVRFVYYTVCVVMDDEKARRHVHCLKSPSWPGMCISTELSFIKRHTSACAIFVAMF